MQKKRQYRGGYRVARQTKLARELRRTETSAEELLRGRLRNRQLLGFKFRRQHQFGDYIADFFCRDANLVVECDGRINELNETWHHDQARDAYMISQGLRVLRFSNQRIFNDIESVLREVEQHLPSPPGRGAEGEGLATRTKPSPQPSPKGRGR